MPINITFPTPSASFNEIWGMDNSNYYAPDTDELVRVVKCSWICHKLTLAFRLIFLLTLGGIFISNPPLNCLKLFLRWSCWKYWACDATLHDPTANTHIGYMGFNISYII